MKLKLKILLSRKSLNKITLFPFFLSLLFSQISFVNELEARYGTSENEYNYSDIKDILKNDIDFASDISSSPDMKAHLSAILVGRMMKELN